MNDNLVLVLAMGDFRGKSNSKNSSRCNFAVSSFSFPDPPFLLVTWLAKKKNEEPWGRGCRIIGPKREMEAELVSLIFHMSWSECNQVRFVRFRYCFHFYCSWQRFNVQCFTYIQVFRTWQQSNISSIVQQVWKAAHSIHLSWLVSWSEALHLYHGCFSMVYFHHVWQF